MNVAGGKRLVDDFLDDGDIGVMSQAIKQCRDTSGIGKNTVPIFDARLVVMSNRSAFVAAVDDFVEKISGARGGPNPRSKTI